MSFVGILKFILRKFYYIGAAVVIFGLVAKNLGLKNSEMITTLGLMMECGIFLLSAFGLDDDEYYNKDKSCNEDDPNKINNKKIFYTDGHGTYFLENPNNSVQLTGGNVPLIYATPTTTKIGGINTTSPQINSQEQFYMPDITSEISKLHEKIEFLKALREKYINDLKNTNINLDTEETKKTTKTVVNKPKKKNNKNVARTENTPMQDKNEDTVVKKNTKGTKNKVK